MIDYKKEDVTKALAREMLHLKIFAKLVPELYSPLDVHLGPSRNTRQPAAYGHLSNQGFSVLNLIQALAGCLMPLARSMEEGKIQNRCDSEGRLFEKSLGLPVLAAVRQNCGNEQRSQRKTDHNCALPGVWCLYASRKHCARSLSPGHTGLVQRSCKEAEMFAGRTWLAEKET